MKFKMSQIRAIRFKLHFQIAQSCHTACTYDEWNLNIIHNFHISQRNGISTKRQIELKYAVLLFTWNLRWFTILWGWVSLSHSPYRRKFLVNTAHMKSQHAPHAKEIILFPVAHIAYHIGSSPTKSFYDQHFLKAATVSVHRTKTKRKRVERKRNQLDCA